ncbi:Hypothetical predicted protein [Mytilus galloprovincialis]|uniref:Uncharacterized protein n=1 Tax=Mytilus galloprovincialis TaxID=29158 RepID=A0A8B6BNJ9_MYTGA|nr:Hypothetical predicted protein [Mytilus galloprovincialis]
MGRFVNDGVGADENALIKRIVVDGSPHLVLFARRDIYLGDEIRHGIVYGTKHLLRSETSRDYIDLERSLKHRPNVTICDNAHLLATHGNKTVEDFYCPNERRLVIISEENIQAAESGFLLKAFESGKPLSKGIPKKNLKQRRAVVDLDMSGSKEKGVKFLTPDKYKFSFALGEARTDERDIDEGGEGVLEIDLEKTIIS